MRNGVEPRRKLPRRVSPLRAEIPYAQSVAGTQYNLVYRRSPDGAAWGPVVQLTDDPDLADVQPHPVLHGTPGHVVMAWTRQKAAGANDHDIWVDPDLAVQ